MKERILYLDMIRIVACVMIVAMHAPIPGTDIGDYVLSTDSLLTAPGIGLFIMVSGALLLPVKMPTKEFLCRRLGKVVVPTLVWTVLYWLVAPITDYVDRGYGLQSFLSIPFSVQFNGVLWFMYMLIGLYLLAPILSTWLVKASKREVEFYLGLWIVTLFYPLIRGFIGVNESKTGILYYFGGYAGYFLLGYYLKQYVRKTPLWIVFLLFAIPFGTAIMMKIRNVAVDFYDLFWYLSVLVVMMSIGWFLLFQRYCSQFKNSSLHRAIVIVSNCCFGIYLSHILVMRGLLWHWLFLQELEGPTQIVVTTALTFIGSFLLTRIISHLPGAAYMVGYKR